MRKNKVQPKPAVTSVPDPRFPDYSKVDGAAFNGDREVQVCARGTK